jgi:hypothetical protein
VHRRRHRHPALLRAEGQVQPGTDFMKIHFGRKLFGQIFILKYLTKFPLKNNRCAFILILNTITLGFKEF